MAAASFCTIAIVGAQEEGIGEPSAYSLTPSNLRKGTNLPYIAGNTGFWYALTQNPHDWDRIEALMIDEDFQWMQTAGFDHVRIPIDPACVGADKITGVINPSSIVPGTGNNSTALQNINAIKTLIARALYRNLAVVIGLQPTFLTQKHYNHLVGVNANGQATGTGWDLPTRYPNETLTTSYGSTWKQTLVTDDDPLHTGNGHPLREFWKSFLSYFPENSTFPVDKVYFALMDEPMVSFTFGTTDFPSSISSTNWIQDWFQPRITAWRAVQLNALKGCLDASTNRRFIVSTAFCDPRDLGVTPAYPQSNSNWGPPDIPRFGNPYSPNAPDNIGQARMDDVIYSVNLYTPFRYTHFDPDYAAGQPNPNKKGEWYRYERDYEGFGDPNTVPGAWDPMQPGLNSVSAWQVNTQSIGSYYENGAYHVWAAPVYLSGAGVLKRDSILCFEPGTCTMNNVAPNWTLQNDTVADRLVWHYDMRKKCTSLGFGWCTWEWIGSFGVSDGTNIHMAATPWSGQRRIHARPLSNQATPPTRKPINTYIHPMLFGIPNGDNRPRSF